MTDDKLSHVNEKGEAHMVDISQKAVTDRQASASGVLHVKPATILALKSGETPKGDVLATARIAAIQAVKNTSQLIPMCHPLPVSGATCDLDVSEDQIRATVTVKTTGRTGVEMEALTGCSVALLTLYDMLKAVDKSMVISGIAVMEKTGGKSGPYKRGDMPT